VRWTTCRVVETTADDTRPARGLGRKLIGKARRTEESKLGVGGIVPVGRERLASDFATKPTLTGERAILRPFVDADTRPLLAALGDPDVRILTGSVHDEAAARRPATPEEEKLAAEWYATRNDTDDRLDLAIIDRASGACVGEAVLNQWEAGNRSCNFRILIGPAGQNRGLGTEATRLIVGHGFEHLGLHRVSLEVYAFNPRARRAYEKSGSGSRASCASLSATATSGSTPPRCPSSPRNGPPPPRPRDDGQLCTPRCTKPSIVRRDSRITARSGARPLRAGVRQPLRRRNTRAAASADNL
jgi:RimJ/RimL family protein N-acetyltransferase